MTYNYVAMLRRQIDDLYEAMRYGADRGTCEREVARLRQAIRDEEARTR